MVLQKSTCNCLSLFCFVKFGVDHGFFKKISFGTLCLTLLKQNRKKVIQLDLVKILVEYT